MDNYISLKNNIAYFHGFDSLPSVCTVHILKNSKTIIIHERPDFIFMNYLRIYVEGGVCADPEFVKIIEDYSLENKPFERLAGMYVGPSQDL